VAVQGLPWCLAEPKTIGLNSLRANILFTTHNSGLSDLDAAAQDAVGKLQEARRLQDVRAGLKRQRFWYPKRYELNGPLLERWFLKTAVNLLNVIKPVGTWLLGGGPPDGPLPDLVNAIFGGSAVCRPRGLYGTARVGERIGPPGHVSFTPILNGQDQFAGAAFEFQGFRFLAWMCDEPVLGIPDETGIAAARYHLESIYFTIGGASSHRVIFRW
jgi:hypothetical protein